MLRQQGSKQTAALVVCVAFSPISLSHVTIVCVAEAAWLGVKGSEKRREEAERAEGEKRDGVSFGEEENREEKQKLLGDGLFS